LELETQREGDDTLSEVIKENVMMELFTKMLAEFRNGEVH
jgi:hypothetical protein